MHAPAADRDAAHADFWEHAPDGHPSTMPVIGESAAPWLASAVLIAALTALTAANDHRVDAVAQGLMFLGLAGSITAAGLVVARSRRALAVVVAEERQRPAADQLSVPLGTESLTYNQGMQRWTTAVLDLLEHAVEVLDGDETSSSQRQLLASAAEDTRDLRDLLDVEARGGMSINDQARLHALGALWETNQRRFEDLAAQTDPAWYRRWRARAAADRNLRHGVDPQHRLELPYRD